MRIIAVIFFSWISLTAIAQQRHESDSPASSAVSSAYAMQSPLTDTLWIFKSFLKDEARLWTSPLRYKIKDISIALPLAIATAAAIATDKSLQKEIQGIVIDNKGIKDAGHIATAGGSNIFVVGVCGAMYFGGMALNDRKLWQTGFLSAYALAHTAFIVSAIKTITGRERPDVHTENNNDWHFFSDINANGFSFSDRFNSAFPSGHAAAAWTLATVVSKQYKEKKWLQPVMYSFAAAVSLSRVTENRHYTSDVIIGSAIGYGIGKYIGRHHRQTRWIMFPKYSNHNLLLAGYYSF